MTSSNHASIKRPPREDPGSTRPLLKSTPGIESTSTLQTALRAVPSLGALFLILGATVTSFGFIELGLHPTSQLSLKILGPTCASIALVLWGVGGTVARLRRQELKRQKHAEELRERVHLHALAIDVLHKPTISPETLRNPRQRQALLKQLRQQTSYLDVAWGCVAPEIIQSTRSTSRRSSCISVTTTSSRRHSSSNLLHGNTARLPRPFPSSMELTDSAHSVSPFNAQLPGIRISRIDSLCCDDLLGLMEDPTNAGRETVRRCIYIESGVSGEVCQISYTSEYSLSGSGTRRSSRGSSCYSGRLWGDFSSRGESDWDDMMSNFGSRDSRLHLAPGSAARPRLSLNDELGCSDLDREDSRRQKDLRSRESGQLLPVASHPAYSARKSVDYTFKSDENPNSLGLLSVQNSLSARRNGPHRPSLPHPDNQAISNKPGDPNFFNSPVFTRQSYLKPPSYSTIRRHSDTSSVEMSDVSDYVTNDAYDTDRCPSGDENRWLSMASIDMAARRPLQFDYERGLMDDFSPGLDGRVHRLLYEIDYSVVDSVDESKIRSQEFEPLVRQNVCEDAGTQDRKLSISSCIRCDDGYPEYKSIDMDENSRRDFERIEAICHDIEKENISKHNHGKLDEIVNVGCGSHDAQSINQNYMKNFEKQCGCSNGGWKNDLRKILTTDPVKPESATVQQNSSIESRHYSIGACNALNVIREQIKELAKVASSNRINRNISNKAISVFTGRPNTARQSFSVAENTKFFKDSELRRNSDTKVINGSAFLNLTDRQKRTLGNLEEIESISSNFFLNEPKCNQINEISNENMQYTENRKSDNRRNSVLNVAR